MATSRWWLWTAGLLAALMAVIAIGNLFGDDGGPLYGKILLAAVLLSGGAAVIVGIRLRPDRRHVGSRMIGVGVLPGAVGFGLFWFPPALLVGTLALVTAAMAFRDADGLETSSRTPFFVLGGAVVAVAALSIGVS